MQFQGMVISDNGALEVRSRAERSQGRVPATRGHVVALYRQQRCLSTPLHVLVYATMSLNPTSCCLQFIYDPHRYVPNALQAAGVAMNAGTDNDLGEWRGSRLLEAR